MNARAFLVELDVAGVRLSRDGDDLIAEMRPGVHIAPYRERITAHKPALLALLRKRAPVEATRPPTGWDGALCTGCRWPALCGVLGPRGPQLAGGPCAAWPAATDAPAGKEPHGGEQPHG